MKFLKGNGYIYDGFFLQGPCRIAGRSSCRCLAPPFLPPVRALLARLSRLLPYCQDCQDCQAIKLLALLSRLSPYLTFTQNLCSFNSGLFTFWFGLCSPTTRERSLGVNPSLDCVACSKIDDHKVTVRSRIDHSQSLI